MALRMVVLWIHAFCGVIWVGASGSFVLAGSAMAGEPEEWRKFALRAAPMINRVGLAIACIIPLTGIGNIYFAARADRFVLPTEFDGILSAKIILFSLMALATWASWRAERAMRRGYENGDTDSGAAMGTRLIRLNILIVVLGAMALMLGVWLSGTR